MYKFFNFLNSFPTTMSYFQSVDLLNGEIRDLTNGDIDREPTTPTLYDKKNKDISRFIKYNWVDSDGNLNAPEYIVNKLGYRTSIEFNDDIPIAVGCSNTFGKGNHEIHTWPFLLSQKINKKIINLGIPGGSMDSSYRVIKWYLQEYNPKEIFFLIPSAFRAEYYIRLSNLKESGLPKNTHIQVGPNFHTFENNTEKKNFQKYIFDTTYSLDETVYLNFYKNIEAIKFLCHQNNVTLYEMYDVSMYNQDNIMKNFDIDKHFSYDLNHFGPEYQELITSMFFDMISKK